MTQKVYTLGEDGIEEASDSPETIKRIMYTTQAMVDKLTETKGVEHAAYVVLLFNVMSFNKMLVYRDCANEAGMLADLIGSWVGKMVSETLCNNDDELATKKLQELSMDTQAMDALINASTGHSGETIQ